MMDVYLLYHYVDEDDDETYKLCGVYSSHEAAESATHRCVQRPGFRDYPSQFIIARYVVDKDEWPDGFGFD